MISFIVLLVKRKQKVSYCIVNQNGFVLDCSDVYTDTGYKTVSDESRRAKKKNSPFVKGVDMIDTVNVGSTIVGDIKIKFDKDGEYNNEFSYC